MHSRPPPGKCEVTRRLGDLKTGFVVRLDPETGFVDVVYEDGTTERDLRTNQLTMKPYEVRIVGFTTTISGGVGGPDLFRLHSRVNE